MFLRLAPNDSTTPRGEICGCGLKRSGLSQPLTCADADAPVNRRAEVAEQPLVGVADVPLGTELAQLLGAHSAAAAGIRHQAYPGGTLGWHDGAVALAAALLG